jgi:hypothetical protein
MLSEEFVYVTEGGGSKLWSIHQFLCINQVRSTCCFEKTVACWYDKIILFK